MKNYKQNVKIPCCFCDSTYMDGRTFDLSCCPICYGKNGREYGVKINCFISTSKNIYWYKKGKLTMLEYNDGRKSYFTRPDYKYQEYFISNKDFEKMILSDPILSIEYRKNKLKSFW